MGEARAATEMRPGKMAAAEMSVTAAEVHVAAAVTTTVAAAVATTVAAATMAAASRQRNAACRQCDGNNERNKSRMEFRHRSLPPATRDITINRRQRDARQPGSRG
jgi:hypothetical protein